MSILLIGDPHFKNDNSIECEQLLEETIKVIKEKKCINFVVIMGDILDTHEKIHMMPFCRATNYIQQIASLKKVFVIIGNHDRINNNIFLTEDHAFNGLKDHPNIVIVDKVAVYNNYLFVPYVPPGRFNEALATIDYDITRCKMIFAHQEFKGAQLGSIVSEIGDVWPENACPVFSGHIHQFQKINNITYIGTPFQHSFYDTGEKFLYMINEESGEEQKIFLNIIKKRIQEISASKLLDYEVDTQYLTKLIINDVDSKILKL